MEWMESFIFWRAGGKGLAIADGLIPPLLVLLVRATIVLLSVVHAAHRPPFVQLFIHPSSRFPSCRSLGT